MQHVDVKLCKQKDLGIRGELLLPCLEQGKTAVLLGARRAGVVQEREGVEHEPWLSIRNPAEVKVRCIERSCKVKQLEN